MIFFVLSAFRCQEGEYRCKNKRCFTKSAENCGGIDWCTDNSGCNVNWGLVGGLIGGIGSALIGLGIGLCLSCYIKRKRNQVNVLNNDCISNLSKSFVLCIVI